MVPAAVKSSGHNDGRRSLPSPWFGSAAEGHDSWIAAGARQSGRQGPFSRRARNSVSPLQSGEVLIEGLAGGNSESPGAGLHRHAEEPHAEPVCTIVHRARPRDNEAPGKGCLASGNLLLNRNAKPPSADGSALQHAGSGQGVGCSSSHAWRLVARVIS